MTSLKVLGVHGLGDQRDGTWIPAWRDAVGRSLPQIDDAHVDVEFVPLAYDHIFTDIDLTLVETMRAVAKLAASGVTSPFRRRRGLFGRLAERVKFTAGYVVAWVEDDEFKAETRKFFLDALREHQPDVVLAHSLGSLITYNALTHPDAQDDELAEVLRSLYYVSLGSQLNNSFVLGNLTPGRLESLPVREWFHLYNHEDAVFTAPIRMPGVANFRQLETHFDIDGVADHAADEYISHDVTRRDFWAAVVNDHAGIDGGERRRALRTHGGATSQKATSQPRRRALLVGIDAYPDPAARLQGCVNDVFLMSSVLQECGFRPDDIRVCLNERATADGIRDRLEWLVDDPLPGDERVFYFSGHGARVPDYGIDGEPDRHTETLVPWDFDWTPETMVADDHIWMLYNQLPWDLRLAMIFDCCHSGGIHRQGGSRRIRALDPPDDIRHRSMAWNVDERMWEERPLAPMNPDFGARGVMQSYFGENGYTTRLGRGALVRHQSRKQYQRARKASANPVGPYLPLIIEACAEEEYAYEYRHGATSYGAFTFSLAQVLRERKQISFEALVAESREKLKRLEYDQTPQVLGPAAALAADVPWR